MDVRHLTLTNFNNRKFKITYYGLEENTHLVLKRRPLILIFPGGSFNHLALREGEPVALAFMAHGFNAAVVSYNLTTDPGNIYPDVALSGLTTIKYFRDHSEKLGIDKEKIVTIGFSAGGHVVSAMNAMATNSKFSDQFNFQDIDVRANASILGYPLININKIGFQVSDDLKNMIPKEKELLDTAEGVNKLTPPTFIFQTTDDLTVLIDNTIEYVLALRKYNVSFESHIFDLGGHGYSLGTPELVSENRSWQINPHVSKWFNLSLEWLEHLHLTAI